MKTVEKKEKYTENSKLKNKQKQKSKTKNKYIKSPFMFLKKKLNATTKSKTKH